MKDRGEKIVSLAREMLAAKDEPIEFTASAPPSLTVKTVCLAVLLSTVSAGMAVRTFDEYTRPANRYEKVEIEALLFYTTRQTPINDETLRQNLADYLALPSLEFMSANDYKTARLYLLDLLP